jgi:hypothetical protein
MPTLGPSLDGFIQTIPSASIGPSLDGFIDAIPSASLGPSLEGFIQITAAQLRSPQLAYRTLAPDRLINTPVDVLGSITNFDLTQTGVFNLYTTPSYKLGFTLGIFCQATAADTVTVVPQISVGIASGETDIFAQESLINFDTVGDVWSNWLVFSKSRNSLATEVIKINVTGATATTLLANIYLIGFEY